MPGSVEASASDGDVWLTGMVGNRFQRDAAEQAVAGLTGVRGIADDIEIFSDIEAADVTDLVQGALDRYGLLPVDTDIQVAASDGTITVTGHIETWAEHDAVIDAAWRGTASRTSAMTWWSPADPTDSPALLMAGERRANPAAGQRPAAGVVSGVRALLLTDRAPSELTVSRPTARLGHGRPGPRGEDPRAACHALARMR